MFPAKQNLREFVANKHVLQKVQKGTHQGEMENNKTCILEIPATLINK